MTLAPEVSGFVARDRLETSGGMMAFIDVGSGPAVLLLHGFPFCSLQWRHLVPAVAARSRVIVPDLVGAGASSMQPGRPLGPAAQALYVRELLAHLEVERLAVGGHGSGGAVAQLLALDHPGVEAMVLLNPDLLDAPRPAAELDPLADVDDPGAVITAISALFEAGARQPGRISEELIRAYGDPYVRDPGALARGALSGREEAVGRSSELGAIEMPVLILWGEDDPFAPVQDADRLNESIASSTLGLLPGCGHWTQQERPEEVNAALLKFLKELEN